MEHGGGAALAARGLEGLAHLAGDLGLAEHDRAQARGDLVQMLGHGGVHRGVEAQRDHVALDPAGAGDRVDHQVDTLMEAVGVEVDLEPVAGAHHDLAGHDRCGAGAAGALGLELLDDCREGVRVPGEGVQHVEVDAFMGGAEGSKHVASLGMPRTAPSGRLDSRGGRAQ